MEQPPYFHSFNSGVLLVYQYTHYLVEPGAQKVMGHNLWPFQNGMFSITEIVKN